MPVSSAEIARESGAAVITAAERLDVRAIILVFEGTGIQAARADLELAFDALDEDGRQLLRALVRKYKGGKIEIDGGPKALKYAATLERWAIRQGIRSLLTDTGLVSLPQEPLPATSDSLQLFSIGLGSFGSCGDEFG